MGLLVASVRVSVAAPAEATRLQPVGGGGGPVRRCHGLGVPASPGSLRVLQQVGATFKPRPLCATNFCMITWWEGVVEV